MCIFVAMKRVICLIVSTLVIFTMSCEDQGLSPVIFVKGVAVESGDTTINLGTSPSLTVQFDPLNATNRQVNWSSSNTAVLKIDSQGVLSTIAEGSSVVTAQSYENPNIQSVVTITVIIPVQSVEIESEDLELNIEQQHTVSVEVLPTTATDKDVEWSTSDSEVAEVSMIGRIEGVGPGKAMIIAKSISNPMISDSIEVTVVE